MSVVESLQTLHGMGVYSLSATLSMDMIIHPISGRSRIFDNLSFLSNVIVTA
jgi:hypothetical protein